MTRVPGHRGANDNASGTAVVLEIARNLSGTSLARQAWFIARRGGRSSQLRAFVWPTAIPRIKAMLVDMVGVNDKLGVGGTRSLTTLSKAVDRSVSTFPAYGSGDHAPFSLKRVCRTLFLPGAGPNYHTRRKTSRVNPRRSTKLLQMGLDVVKQLLDVPILVYWGSSNLR